MSALLDDLLRLIRAVEAQHELDRRPEHEPFDPDVFAEWVKRYTCDLLPTMQLYVEPEWTDDRMGLAFGSVTLSQSAYQRALGRWMPHGPEPCAKFTLPGHDERHAE